MYHVGPVYLIATYVTSSMSLSGTNPDGLNTCHSSTFNPESFQKFENLLNGRIINPDPRGASRGGFS